MLTRKKSLLSKTFQLVRNILIHKKKSYLFLVSPPDAKISLLKYSPLVSTFLFNCVLCAFLGQVGIIWKRQQEENLSAT